MANNSTKVKDSPGYYPAQLKKVYSFENKANTGMEDSFLTVQGQRRRPELTEFQRLGKALKRRLPIFQWLPLYTKNSLLQDFVAGISVALTAIPQTMAYAVLAGLSPEYGLYSSFIGPLVYIFFGTCRQVTIGPTAIIALVAFKTCGEDFAECVILTSFYGGVIEILLFVLQLGSCVSLISDTVTVGFTAGAALTIASPQLKSLFGLSLTSDSSTFLGYSNNVFRNIYSGSVSVPDTVLGLSCVLLLLVLQRLNLILKPCQGHGEQGVLRKIIWALSVSRNVIVVLSTIVLAFCWGNPPFKLTGTVRAGFPHVAPPQFLLPNKRNSTAYEGDTLTFWETIGELGVGPLIVALIAILQNVAISKAYGSGQRINGNQEILALGITSILGGFFSAQPTSGSFSRSAVNESSGVKSQFGGFFTGVLIIVSLLVLTPTFHYIPKASLAAVIICAILLLVDYDLFLPMWRVSKVDALICAVTFLTSLLLGMEYGISIGVGISITKILYEFLTTKLSSEFKTDEDTQLPYIVLKPLEGFRFPSCDAIRKYVNRASLEYGSTHRILVLDCLKWGSIDYTVAATLASLIKSINKSSKYLVLVNVDPAWVLALGRTGLNETELLFAICEDSSSLPNHLKKFLPSERDRAIANNI